MLRRVDVRLFTVACRLNALYVCAWVYFAGPEPDGATRQYARSFFKQNAWAWTHRQDRWCTTARTE